jgi:ribosomal protein S18 acetylase RimI-like enzyme
MNARTTTLRPARNEDYASFARLFPELATDDPVPDAARYERDLVSSMLLAETAGAVSGYLYYQVLEGLLYVRHIVVAPEARRSGVGRALMGAARELGRAGGATRWCLNVKPGNAPAIALYERCGLVKGYRTNALRVDWSATERLPASPATKVRPIEPSDDARVEAEAKVVPGLLQDARKRGGRVLLVAEDGASVTGAAIFDPGFPGAYPFKAARPDVAFTILHAMKPHARSTDTYVGVVIEDQAAVARALLDAGATLRFEIDHMSGPLAR